MDIPPPDASALCQHCGFCCDGTLFDQGHAEEKELPQLAAGGMDVFQEGGKNRFRMPCPAFEGACCKIYATRFATCRSFRCALLRRLEAGKMDMDQALHTVGKAKALLARIEARSPGSRPARARRTLAAEKLAQVQHSGDREAGHAYLELMALEKLLQTDFRDPKKDDQEI
jgi:hypothetical protein